MPEVAHDPVREAGKLRDHLSSLDRPIVLLLGAGASASVVGTDTKPLIPAISALTKNCHNSVVALGTWAELFWEGLIADLKAADSPLSIRDPTIEDILSAVRNKLTAMSSTDTSIGVTRAQLRNIEENISSNIAAAANPDASRVPIELPHHSLARWIGRVHRTSAIEIFTTNYDTLIERALEDERLPVFDGFVGSTRPFFWPPSLAHSDSAPAASWTRLWKLHGSINWRLQKDPLRGNRIVRDLPGADAHLILPSSQKYDESRKLPYVAMLDRFTRALSEREGCLVVTVGFSFGDQHINEILSDALDTQERMHVVALQFEDPDEGGALSALAAQHTNMLVYGPGLAIIGSVRGPWKLLEPTNDRSAQTVDVFFDSDAIERDDDDALHGKFRLGDFVWFAQFLDEIVARRG